MTPYICENTIVKSRHGREGQVISVDRKTKTAVIKSETSIWTTKTENLTVVSYKEVK